MKKHLFRLMSTLFAASLILCDYSCAFADIGINNVIIGEEKQSADEHTNSAYKNGLELIKATGDADNITLPKPESYLVNPAIMYINAQSKNSIYSYRKPWLNKSLLGSYPYHGTKVLVVAEEGDFDCIIFNDNANKAQASWVYASELTGAFPGVEQTIGTPCVQYANNVGDIKVSWSKEKFVGSQQKYTVLGESAKNCVQFVLDYQVIGRGDADTSEVLGDRVVYVNDGNGWIAVGRFSYSQIDATHVTVNLEKPMNILAIATIADCAKPNTFIFRQSVLDVMVTA